MVCSAQFFRSIRWYKPSRPRSITRARRSSAGFSLVEILIVVSIMGLLVGLVGPNLIRQFETSKSKTANIQIQSIRAALDIFLTDVGRYPTESEGLGALVTGPAGVGGWSGPYLRDGIVPLDPWGRAYLYQPSGDKPNRVLSYGADGTPGGEGPNADIGL